MALYRLSRYRPPPAPRKPPAPTTAGRDQSADRTPSPTPVAPNRHPDTNGHSTTADGAPSHDVADGELLNEAHDDGRHVNAAVDLPDVAWISARDGTRAPGDLEDQAARYHHAESKSRFGVSTGGRAVGRNRRIGFERGRAGGAPAGIRQAGARADA